MKKRTILVVAFALAVFMGYLVMVASAADDVKPLVSSLAQTQKGMSMWQLIKSGGWCMYPLGVLSVGALILIMYGLITLKAARLSPRDFGEQVIKKLEAGKIRDVEKLCVTERNIFSKIVMAGLDKKEKGPLFAREAMENSAKKEVGDLWQLIGFLADIAQIATLLGLFGTILGMIQSFNAIAFELAVVKPMLIAAGVSKAMITTAAGLLIAIPAQAFYSYFKAKVQEISNTVELYGADIIKIIEGL